MNQICPKCFYTGKAKYKTLNNYNIPLGGVFIALGVYSLSFVTFSEFLSKDSYILHFILISLPLFLIGAFLIYNYHETNSDLCPKCNYGHMLIIGSKKADKLIEENHIRI